LRQGAGKAGGAERERATGRLVTVRSIERSGGARRGEKARSPVPRRLRRQGNLRRSLQSDRQEADKKIGDKGPTFKIVNTGKLEVLYGKIVVYFYDKAGKQIDVSGGDMPRHRLTCAGDIFAGPVKPGEKVFMNFSCVKKEDVPKGAKDIEGEIQTVAFTDDAGKNDTFWRNDDLAPDARPKGGIKK
jgi:hypothetical protein